MQPPYDYPAFVMQREPNLPFHTPLSSRAHSSIGEISHDVGYKDGLLPHFYNSTSTHCLIVSSNQPSNYLSKHPFSFLLLIMECEDEAINTQEPASAAAAAAAAADPNSAISALIADSLKQQAAQFETIISGLRDQFKELGGSSSRRKSTPNDSTKNTPDTSSKQDRLKQPLPSSAYSTPTSSAKKGPRKSKTPVPKPAKPVTPPVRRRHPLQLLSTDFPNDFKTTKDALFLHIKIMWGLFKANDVPAPIDPSLLKAFYARFSKTEQIEAALLDPASADVVAQNNILTLKSLRGGDGKIGRGMANLDEMYILYIHGILAKVGIRVWGPDLNEAADSLYNSACRLTALNTFRQLMATGAYNYMNVNPDHVNSMSRFISAYNHYVHYWMASKFKSELKPPGRAESESARKLVQKHRERLKQARVRFLDVNRAKYPPRYKALCENVLAHSDDEQEPGKNYLTIKTLAYRSKNASKFFRRLDIEMQKAVQVSGKAVPHLERRLPKVPVPSAFSRAPRDLPIDFYKASWFNNLSSGQKRLIPNANQVAFLPDAAQSLFPSPQTHPDERLSDKAFNGKYLDVYLPAYELCEEDKDAEDSDEGSVAHSVDDHENVKMNEPDESDSDCYDEGDFGDLYDDTDDEAEQGKGKGKGKANAPIDLEDD
ncbi:uncharacterized protein MELLADRAFT_89943 [Melampsora larici-populina 98AG31]|uniref:Uncharacterized protein n=1 Tax=Melampsora larici-populina (strain 98AG31 / pathotype 3-4-7) TaxID=747676 RepID=F4RV68_MELLP|nr:uncharacterized protein MELLADRAFT_89943 [Melampsora larici-populina 98AG31]EGG03570.1 hypothetical protein MELLADRAFT_89943 [Melampsora larici-populina 98AG31]